MPIWTRLACLLLAMLPVAAHAQNASWGVLDEIARREWTTEKEPRPRVSKFKWIEEGQVLEARHGFVSRLQFGEAKFADTVQRFVLDPSTGAINVTYTYEDGRPPLKTVIRIEPDGTAIETFTDASGVKKRNIYRSPKLSVNTIERQEMRETAWSSLGTTRKAGLTREEIAENKRRAEEERQLAIATENARRAAEAAQRAAEEAEQQAAYEAQQAEDDARNAQMRATMNAGLMDAIRGIGTAIQQRNQQQAELNRLRVAAEQETAQRRAEAARAEANRIAAENARRVQEANARQQAIADQLAAQRASSDSARQQQLAQADADRVRRAAEQKRQADAQAQRDAEQRQAAADAERQRREAQARAAEAERRRQADERAREQARLLAERNALVDWPESVTLCAKNDDQARFGNYRCTGSLQMNYVNFEKPNWEAQLNLTCGGPYNKRDLGVVAGYRAFGCGFGLRPNSPDDVPRRFGVGYVPGRITFRCPRSASSCQSR